MSKHMGESAWLMILLAFPLLPLEKNYPLAIAENPCGGMREISSRILLTGHRLLLSKSTSCSARTNCHLVAQDKHTYTWVRVY
jgi:hypothetical protein